VYSVALVPARLQPPHAAHLALIRRALDLAPRVVVAIGSAHQARSPRAPFSGEDCAAMLRLALTPDERQRVHPLPVRDHHDPARWFADVRAGVAGIARSQGLTEPLTVAVVGHVMDATRDYLRRFDGWPLHEVGRQPGADSAALLDALFANIEAGVHSTVDGSALERYLGAWASQPCAAPLAEEWRELREYRAAWTRAPYPPVFVTVDTVIHCAGHVLLIERDRHPGKGLWAVPGGFIDLRETAYQSALRELAEETGLVMPAGAASAALKGQAVFDAPERSQRGRTISHVFFFDLGPGALPPVQGGDDARSARWTPLAELPALESRLLDDHFQMLDHFLRVLPRPDPT
jgi:bifunctional NMN adenylyltransferase/nudix hydrolase